MKYKSCWITLNRACNLRCKWCYARNTNYLKSNDMDLNTVFEIVDICDDLGIKHITLIGGEPTLYPHFIDVIKYIHGKKIRCGFITNGLKFNDETFVREIIDCGIHSFSISLKGENRSVFKDITGKDVFDKVVNGIKNCLKNNTKVTVSMVLTDDNITSYLAGIEQMKKIGVDNFHLSFCYEFDILNKYMTANSPKGIIKDFMKSYPELDRVTEHKFHLSQSYPMCLWDKDFINMLCSKNQITSVCQLLTKSGLLFDTEANIIPCNAMYQLKLGQLHKDFNNAEELMQHTKTGTFKAVYNKLCGVPDKECLNCEDLKNCGGGCVCQWTNYSYKQLFNMGE